MLVVAAAILLGLVACCGCAAAAITSDQNHRREKNMLKPLIIWNGRSIIHMNKHYYVIVAHRYTLEIHVISNNRVLINFYLHYPDEGCYVYIGSVFLRVHRVCLAKL